ncbi:hypothetical protein BJ138DRAFT_1110405 [Hygrophoropsis aurantiaca]|uniref:Uncharacterized protein n=1 Tax=Hygrophoropsis aurantiaca TaxID=72124 RepID=A0ACB8AMH5_9AGAM|nr:hypothetical protein BJ138DRAFT_1110405 [Hygrophoropsis aurantiaca]
MERSIVDTSSVMAGIFISATVFLILTAQIVMYFRAIAAQDALWIKATWVAAGFNIHHLCMSFPMGGLYTTCLYANFLARTSYLNDKKFTEDTLESDSKVLEPIEFVRGRYSLSSMRSDPHT